MDDPLGWVLIFLGIVGAMVTVFATWGGNDLIISTVMMLASLAIVALGVRRLLRRSA